eukprot:5506829-Amphidinium_carterae.2
MCMICKKGAGTRAPVREVAAYFAAILSRRTASSNHHDSSKSNIQPSRACVQDGTVLACQPCLVHEQQAAFHCHGCKTLWTARISLAVPTLAAPACLRLARSKSE